jgi:tRNA U34 5-carboxymethylaminomethyl modifying GTPase MnmE/TrmE
MNTTTTFFQEVEKVSAQGQKFSEENKKFDDDIITLIRNFKYTIPNSSSTNTLFNIVSEVSTKFDDVFEKWKKQVDENKHTQKFRDEFSDQFLIIIYGKVKAGKSTLGNYFAEQAQSHNIGIAEFFKYDEAGSNKDHAKRSALQSTCFETKITECTSAIQGFALNGLTWIDTPGLGSMTDINGAKAKEYIEKADLIIYPMASDSPGRASDLNEISDIVKKGKKLLVLITKSDTNEEDEIDGEVVNVCIPKNDKDRNDQENHVNNELVQFKDNLVGGRPISISVFLAQQDIAGSNLETFFERLTSVIKDNGVQLKASEPINRLLAFKKRLTSDDDELSISRLKDTVDEFYKKTKEIQKDFESNIERLKNRVLADCIELVNQKITPSTLKTEGGMLLSKINQEAKLIIKEHTEELMTGVFQSIQDHVSQIQIDMCNVDIVIKDRYRDETTTQKRRKATDRAGTWRDNFVFNLFAGEPYEIVDEEITRQVKVGDNSADVIKMLSHKLKEVVQSSLNNQHDQLQSFYFDPMDGFISQFNLEYDRACYQITKGVK